MEREKGAGKSDWRIKLGDKKGGGTWRFDKKIISKEEREEFGRPGLGWQLQFVQININNIFGSRVVETWHIIVEDEWMLEWSSREREGLSL